MINTYKRLICPLVPDGGQEVKFFYPIKDIYTRVVMESEGKIWN